MRGIGIFKAYFTSHNPALILISNKLIYFPQADFVLPETVISECPLPVFVSTLRFLLYFLPPSSCDTVALVGTSQGQPTTPPCHLRPLWGAGDPRGCWDRQVA